MGGRYKYNLTAMSTDAPAIQLRSVTKTFRRHRDRDLTLKSLVLRGFHRKPASLFTAIDSINLDVRRGETIALVGHNGSGKSTLLKCIAGIYSPDSGALSINGRVSALLELGSGFHPDLTGTENVFLNGALLGISRTQLKRDIDKIVDFSGLGEFMDQPIRTYSSGMYMRLGFSVAASVDAEVLLVDEVLAVGDEEFQRRCLEKMSDLREQGRTIVIVSHGLAPLRAMCDRAAWLEHGKLLAVGKPGDIIDQYVETAGLSGSDPGPVSSLEAGLTTAARHKEVESEDVATNNDGARPYLVAEADDKSRGNETANEAEPDSRVDFRATGAHGSNPDNLPFSFVGAGLVNDIGAVVHQVRTGDDLVVRVRWQNRKTLVDTVIGVWFTRVDGIVLASATNRSTSFEVASRPGFHELDIRFPAVPFLPGSFFLGVASTDARGERIFAHHARAARFDVAPGLQSDREGLVALTAVWAETDFGVSTADSPHLDIRGEPKSQLDIDRPRNHADV